MKTGKLYTVYEYRSFEGSPVAITSFESVEDAQAFLSWFKCDEYQYVITSFPMFACKLADTSEVFSL